MTSCKRRKNSWRCIPRELKIRFLNAVFSIKFMVSFILGLFCIGGIGVWLPYVSSEEAAKVLLDSHNLFTYSSAILGTLFIEYALSKKSTADLDLLAVFTGIIALSLIGFGFIYTQSGFSLLTLSGTLFSVLLFLFVNVNDHKYDSEEDASEATSTGYEDASVARIIDQKEIG